jgi:hypothetical protein
MIHPSPRPSPTDIKPVILTLEGALLRVKLPAYCSARTMSWEAQYRRPGGGFATRTVAEAMREDLVKQFMRTYRELEFAAQEKKPYGEPEDYCGHI